MGENNSSSIGGHISQRCADSSGDHPKCTLFRWHDPEDNRYWLIGITGKRKKDYECRVSKAYGLSGRGAGGPDAGGEGDCRINFT